MSKRQNLYIGKSGQMAVMAEFLVRGYNVGIPEVDVGDDIFVVRDDNGELSRIQVKTGTARVTRKGFSSQFNVPIAQLEEPKTPDLHYVVVIRHQERWSDYVIIDRESLNQHRLLDKIGSIAGEIMHFHLSFSAGDVLCSGFSLRPYLNNWERWPVIPH